MDTPSLGRRIAALFIDWAVAALSAVALTSVSYPPKNPAQNLMIVGFFIVEAALRNRCSSFVIDGEAVLLGVDGRPDFDGLHRRKQNHQVQFYAFDILVADGEDVRQLPLSMRKTNLSRLFARRVDGIFLSDFERGEIGPDLFRHACLLGLEGLVSKHTRIDHTGPDGRRIG